MRILLLLVCVLFGLPGDASAVAQLTDGADPHQDQAPDVEGLRDRADQGDPEAQSDLGVLYLQGRGVGRDDAEAARWFQRAADQGYAPAQQTLGALYAFGRGVPVDLVAAARWYREAANQNLAGAQGALGMAYAVGSGVEQDLVTAYMWLSLAGAQASADKIQRFEGFLKLVVDRMSSEQITEGKRRAREWRPVE